MEFVSKVCHSCNIAVPDNHVGRCPHCGEENGYAIGVEINENVNIHDFVDVQVTRIPRSKQVKDRPYNFILGLIFFIIPLLLSLWENPLSFLFQVIIGSWGFALMPINEIIEIH